MPPRPSITRSSVTIATIGQEIMSELVFVFSFDNHEHDTLGCYWKGFNVIEIQLDSITKSTPFRIPESTLFNKLWRVIHAMGIERHCIETIYTVLEHEVLHHALNKADCPTDKHHFATDEIEFGVDPI